MNENKYFVTINNETIAENMSLDTALIVVKAIFNEYYNDHSMVVAIEEMERTKENEDD